MHRTLTAAIAASIAGLAAPANATWSIILVDTRTGEVALGSATCLTSFDLRDGTPVLLTGIGGATAQSFVDQSGQNRVVLRDQISFGTSPDDILTFLSTFDNGHQTRQYGIVDVLGRAATFSGTGAGDWKGGKTGKVGDIAYAIQGNVIAGECVVDQAVAAALNTPGDLAAKLMASMEAARLTGGDGRCSCSPNDPDGCGCPVPDFDKSAHIAYMLIARAGDRDGGHGLYRAAANSRAVVVGLFDADGRLDILSANQSGNSVSFLSNNTPQDHQFPTFSLPANKSIGTSPRAIASADIDGDGELDIAVTNFTTNLIRTALGLGDGTFFGDQNYAAGGTNPSDVALADLDGVNGPDLINTNIAGDNLSVRFNDGDGKFSDPVLIAVGDSPVALDAADLDKDGDIDLAIALSTPSRVQLLFNDGAGGLSGAAPIDNAAQPSAIVAADLDKDGDNDLAVTSQSGSNLRVYINDGSGVLTPTTIALPVGPNSVAAGDVTGDGLVDIAAAGGGRFLTVKNLGAGQFALDNNSLIFGNLNEIALADMDSDGDLDVAAAANGSVETVRNYGSGKFDSGIGQATGDYWMNFNIAFQSNQSPDPVFQLQDLYDDWRAELAGRPDAVQTTAIMNPGTIKADGKEQSKLIITPIDWQGAKTTKPIQSITVQHAKGSAGSCSIGPVEDLGNGSYACILTAGTIEGTDRFTVTINDGIRPVILMPDPSLILTAGCYADCDGSGTLDIDDFICYQTLYGLNDPGADCDGSGELDIDDFICFQTAYGVGCG